MTVFRPFAVCACQLRLLLPCLLCYSAGDRPVGAASTPTAVLTSYNDISRTGANLTETILTTNNVNTNQFGLLYTRPVDDQIYAQPLIMTNVSIPGKGGKNIVLVATVNDSVYAFDADDASVIAPYWAVSFVNPPSIVAPANTDLSAIGACGGNYRDFSGKMGIVGTPVIDPATGTIYFVARTKEFGSTFVQRLHALDVATGAERPNSPVTISATYPGTGAGSVGGVLTFDPLRQNQRQGLALVNGVVYIPWASHCDRGPYHGWFIGYDASSLQRVVVFNSTPDGSNGGLWMSGVAPAADSNGNIYLVTGNGTVDTSGMVNHGESFLKLTRNGAALSVASWFTPYNYQMLENGDIDLGAGGLLLIPGTTLAFSGGKEGIVYLVNRDNMGGLTSSTTTNDNILQTFRVSPSAVHGGMVWWDGPGVSYGYLWPASVSLQQYIFNRVASRLVLPPFAQSPTPAPIGQPGGQLALSANGAIPGSAIVWAAHQLSGSANQSVRPGILHAYDAQDVSHELWNSEMLSARDSVGNFAKFVPASVANGKVYLPTFSNRLNVYGLYFINTSPSILQQPQSASAVTGASVTFSVTADGTPPLKYQWKFNSNAISGATNSSYSIINVQPTNAGNYSVAVTNSFGSAVSSNALLTVNAPPAILSQPQSQVLLIGQDATFNVLASGSSPLTFQWRLNGNNIINATASSYTISGAQFSNDGFYSVMVTNGVGSVVSSNASLLVWPLGASGDNSWGQTTITPTSTNLIAIAAGAWHSLGLLESGRVIAWGDDENGQCDVPSYLQNVISIAAGGYHSLALRADKTVVGWGANDSLQASVPSSASNVVALAAGTWHSLALRADGKVIAWGDNSRGQVDVPVGLDKVVAVAAGGSHSLALRADGTVIAWGENTDANGTFVGQSQVPMDLAHVIAIAAGDYHSLAVKADGTVVAWGDNSHSQAAPPSELGQVVAVAAGGSHSLALRADGSVTAWGNNINGQCNVPATTAGVISVAAGEAHTLLLVGNSQTPPYSLHPVETGTQFSVVLQTYAGKNYTLEFNNSLSPGSWVPIVTNYGNGQMQFLIDPAAISAQRFYRIREW